MQDDDARDYRHDHRAQSEIDRWKARAEKAEAECQRLRADLQRQCRHLVSVDTMPPFCGTCGAEDPWSKRGAS